MPQTTDLPAALAELAEDFHAVTQRERLQLLAANIHAVLALGVGFVVVGMLLRTGG